MKRQHTHIYGIHAVEAALQSGQPAIHVLWIDERRKDRRISQLADAAHGRSIPVRRQAREALDETVEGANHQGVVAECDLPAARSESDLLDLIDGLDHPPFLLVLDGVQDPHNLGACLRSADAAGVDGVIVPRDKACGLTAAVVRVASGAASSVPFFQVGNLARALKAVQQAGVWITGLAGEAGQSLYDLDLKGPLALVLGAEGKGLRRLTRESCDHLAALPMHGMVSSLNVSVTTGICLFEAVRQRQG